MMIIDLNEQPGENWLAVAAEEKRKARRAAHLQSILEARRQARRSKKPTDQERTEDGDTVSE